jgi:hypothetical protein
MMRAGLILLALMTSALAMEIPPMEKEDVRATLESMGWKEVTVVAMLQGVDEKGTAAPIYSTVIALGTKEGRHQAIRQTLYYDKQYGWFIYELGDKKALIWSKAGYQEIQPWTT